MKKSERRNKDRELQDLEEKNQVDIKLHKQSVKHLLFEQQDEITRLKTSLEGSLKEVEDISRKDESALRVCPAACLHARRPFPSLAAPLC